MLTTLPYTRFNMQTFILRFDANRFLEANIRDISTKYTLRWYLNDTNQFCTSSVCSHVFSFIYILHVIITIYEFPTFYAIVTVNVVEVNAIAIILCVCVRCCVLSQILDRMGK